MEGVGSEREATVSYQKYSGLLCGERQSDPGSGLMVRLTEERETGRVPV